MLKVRKIQVQNKYNHPQTGYYFNFLYETLLK